MEALAADTGHCKRTQLTGHVLLHVGSNNSVVRASPANCSQLNSSFGRQFLGQWRSKHTRTRSCEHAENGYAYVPAVTRTRTV